MFGYIPSPSTNGINLGPLRLHMYGFLIVAGVFAAVWLADRRWRARGGEPGTFSAIALWAVPGGLIGARLYHVATDYELYTHHPLDALKIWQGGLGIWGGIAGGVLAGWIYIRRQGLDFAAILDTVAPALPLAQAIGRWGNFFNQELFGRPTTLPWGLKIDAANRPPAYVHYATFHPTFLYEFLWDLAVVGLVLLIERRVRLRKGYLFAVYVALYTFGRFFTEYLRIDFAHKILGLRINDWVSVIIFVVATALVLRKGLAREEPAERDDDTDRPLVTAAARPVGPSASVGGETIEEGAIGPLALSDPAATESEIDLPGPEPAAEPVATAEPLAAAEPMATAEPLATAQPVATAEPLATAEPVAAAEPLAAAEPARTAEHASTTEPALPEPTAIAEPGSAPDPAPESAAEPGSAPDSAPEPAAELKSEPTGPDHLAPATTPASADADAAATPTSAEVPPEAPAPGENRPDDKRDEAPPETAGPDRAGEAPRRV